ncbi:MAG: hypothetical protein AB8B99_05585 [Phormidesmis sp.]
MLKSPLLFAISILVTLVSWTSVAKAENSRLELSFALPPIEEVADAESVVSQPVSLPAITEKKEVSPVKPEISLTTLSRPTETLREISDDSAHRRTQIAEATNLQQPASQPKAQNDIGIRFLQSTLSLPEQHLTEKKPLNLKDTTHQTVELDDWIFAGGSKSLVAHTVGSAEGTRHWSGQRTKAYYGHTDPGNGVWNLGTFSYQHEASSPEDADEKQLRRLKSQGIQLQQQASQRGLQLSLQEKLNGLDLANQAPLAALGEGGYVDRLAQAYRLQLKGEEAIAWARVRAYIDPNTQTWNAPGLGNNLHSISKDQERRMAAIDKALRAYEQGDHIELTLASLDSIHLEGSGLEQTPLPGANLDHTTPATSFGSVSEEFKLAARNISAAELNMIEDGLTEVAVTFDLPSASSQKNNSENLAVTPSETPSISKVGDRNIESPQESPNVDVSSATETEDTSTVDSSEPATTEIKATGMATTVMSQATFTDQPAIALSFASAPQEPLITTNTITHNALATNNALTTPTPTLGTETITPSDNDSETNETLTNRETIPEERLNAAHTSSNELSPKPTLDKLLDGILERETGEALTFSPSARSDSEQITDRSSHQSLLRTEDKIVRPQ